MKCSALATKVATFRGKIEMPVLAIDGVEHLFVEKADLIRSLRAASDQPSPWAIISTEEGVMRLDTA